MIKSKRLYEGWYRTNVFYRTHDVKEWTVVEIARSMDNSRKWNIEPLDHGLDSKKEAMLTLGRAVHAGRWNGYLVKLKKS